MKKGISNSINNPQKEIKFIKIDLTVQVIFLQIHTFSIVISIFPILQF